ncbi:MAG: recombinase family protein [Candidatus Eremiobacterota bacterium]
MKRVAIYIRVSTQEQAEAGYSVPEQKEKLINHCKAQGWMIYDIYIDPGYSGENLARPALQKLISEVENFDIVLVYRLDRLSRRVLDACRFIEEIFQSNHITFVSLTESINTATPNGLMIFHMIASVAQNERMTIKERLKMGKEGRAKEGLYHGSGTPIGYDYIEGKLIINEYEALQVREIYYLYLQGHGTRKIAEILRSKGYKHKKGSWIHGSSVVNVLKNPIYTGQIRHKNSIFQGQHEPIISKETFNQVKAIRRNRKSMNTKVYTPNSLLSGMLFCGFCGGRYAIRLGCDRTKTKNYRYYTCYSRNGTRHMVKDPNCKNKIWREENLDSIIEKKILHLSIEEFKVKSPEKKEPVREKKIIEKRIEDLNKKINKLLDLYQVDSTAEIKEIGERIRNLHEEKKALEETLEGYKEEKKPVIINKEFKNFINAVPDAWKNSSLQEKRKILEILIEKVVVKNEEIKIVWRENFYIQILSP